MKGIFAGIGLVNGHIGFQNERKYNNTKSLILSGRLDVSRYSHPVYYLDSLTQRMYQKRINYDTGICLTISAQPRWFFDYQKRYQRGADIRLNSGWFLGLPIEIRTSELDFKTPFDIDISACPIIGFRQALSTKLYIEAATGPGIMKSLFNNRLLLPIFIFQINACYTLK